MQYLRILLVCCAFCTIASLHISILPACRYTPANILILQYLFDCFMSGLGIYFSHKLERQTKMCQKEQEQFLQKLLKKQSSTTYGKDKQFSTMKASDKFRQQHPLTFHCHYEPYLKQILGGEENVLIKGKPLRFGLTSGTTGQRKMIVTSKSRILLFILKFVPIGQRILRKSILPSFSPLLKTCYVYTHTQPKDPCPGITMGPTTMLNLPDLLYRLQYSTPPAGMRLTNERQATYVHLLFALRDPDLQAIFTIFAASLYNTFKILEEEWPCLVNDMREGCISDSINLDHEVKISLEKELHPDPKRADELEAEFKKGFYDITRRIWPRMTSLWGVSSGSMTVYEDILKVKFIGDLPIVSMIYNSTECLLGVLHGGAKRTEYIPFPGDVFYEFIPVENCSQEQPDTLLAEEVMLGSYYEVVITNIDGLYRYRMGDVVKVTGFYNKTPLLEYGHRVGDVLDMHGERTPEIIIKAALQEALTKYATFHLVDFTCVESDILRKCTGGSDEGISNHYSVIAELDVVDGQIENLNNLKKLALDVDLALCDLSSAYSDCRDRDLLQPLLLILVRPDTFREFRYLLSSKSNGSTMQVKVPKVLGNDEFIQFFLQRKLEE
nr:uncharacterized protein LOC129255353 [Lytechinus pictus]